MKIVGIDLAAEEHNPTGVCVFQDWQVRCTTVKSDEEIVEFVRREAPDLIVVDAPLGMSRGPWRDGEEELIRMGKRPLPLTMESMKKLVERGLLERRYAEGGAWRLFYGVSYGLGAMLALMIVAGSYSTSFVRESLLTAFKLLYLFTAVFLPFGTFLGWVRLKIHGE